MEILRREKAGRSAERYFRRARKHWRRRMASTILAAVGSLLLAAALVGMLLPENTNFAMGLILGVTLALFLWAWDDPPEVIAKWGRGAEGERRTARALRPLGRKHWYVRHDLAGRFGNIDHVVVGSAGVFLLDSKNLSGRAAVQDGVLSISFPGSPVDDYSLTGLPRALHGAARGFRDRLAQKLGWIADIYPVVVLCGEFPQRQAEFGRLSYVAVGDLAGWLEQQPRRIAPKDADAITQAIDELPPAPDFAEIHATDSS